ncbi:MAG TPA: hypothetical protein VFW40_02220 [Capsulimonadaceae bacterium]|nr:hypothetical protein [Capsulimonadaceae bacterium]
MLNSSDAENVANRELQPGETLVWVGKPIPSRVAWSGGTIPIFLFGLLWTAFFVFWTGTAFSWAVSPSRTTAPPTALEIAFPFFGIPFLLVGLAMLSMPFWAYRTAGQTVYAVTDKRLLIITRLRTLNVQSISPEILIGIDCRERPDGSGDLIFTSNQVTAVTPASNRRNLPPEGFYGVPNVREVEGSVRTTFPKFAV